MLAWGGDFDSQKQLLEMAQKVLVDLFETENMDDYAVIKQKLSSYEDIENYLGLSKIDMILFHDIDDVRLSLRDRINRYIKYATMEKTFFKFKDADIFEMLFLQKIMQVLDIVITCINLNSIPYVIARVPFMYLSMLIFTFTDEINEETKVKETVLMHLIYTHIKNNCIDSLERCKFRFKNEGIYDHTSLQFRRYHPCPTFLNS